MQSQIEIEKAANEERLKHTLLKENDDFDDGGVLEAEFMPTPGSFKYRESWIGKGTCQYI